MRISCVRVAVVCSLFLWKLSLADEDTTPTSASSAVYERKVSDPTCNCVCGDYRRTSKIINGVEAKPHEFPWAVYLKNNHNFICGGTLITPRHVLTAAHCTNEVDKDLLTVTFGAHNRFIWSGIVQTRRVVKMTSYAGFTMKNYHNDIAVLELDRPVKLGPTVRTACLPLTDAEDYTGMKAVVVGWGRRSEQARLLSPTLQKVAVPIMSAEECRSQGYPAFKITDNMLCAGFLTGGMDSCKGDSGGPMHTVVDNVSEVIGIVSWGYGCARPYLPGVYTRVARYLGWIDEQLDGECRCTRRPRQSHRTPRISPELL